MEKQTAKKATLTISNAHSKSMRPRSGHRPTT